MRSNAWMALVCLIILAWAQYAWGAESGGAVGGIVRPLGVGDVSLPVALLLIWNGIKTRWDETIEVYRERAKAQATVAAEVKGLSTAIRERGGRDDA
jgi:hypothetical protein